LKLLIRSIHLSPQFMTKMLIKRIHDFLSVALNNPISSNHISSRSIRLNPLTWLIRDDSYEMNENKAFFI